MEYQTEYFLILQIAYVAFHSGQNEYLGFPAPGIKISDIVA